MNLTNLNAKLRTTNPYRTQYNSFWKWKVQVEQKPGSHILDDEHRANACTELLKILPGWQTWRGTTCNYTKEFPIALAHIANFYSQIRQYSLLDFDRVPTGPLQEIWHELGRVKESSGNRRAKGDYCIIAICKPLMFLWGQTLPFDSRNRKNIRLDHSLSLTTPIPHAGRWVFSEWTTIMSDFQRELCRVPSIISILQATASNTFNSKLVVPYGRYLDNNYF
jgi:hypothetical protein